MAYAFVPWALRQSDSLCVLAYSSVELPVEDEVRKVVAKVPSLVSIGGADRATVAF